MTIWSCSASNFKWESRGNSKRRRTKRKARVEARVRTRTLLRPKGNTWKTQVALRARMSNTQRWWLRSAKGKLWGCMESSKSWEIKICNWSRSWESTARRKEVTCWLTNANGFNDQIKVFSYYVRRSVHMDYIYSLFLFVSKNIIAVIK